MGLWPWQPYQLQLRLHILPLSLPTPQSQKGQDDLSRPHFVPTDLISEEPRPGLRPLRHSKSGKPLTQSLRLNNNVLNELRDFKQVLSQLLEHPENLAWIDLSFNDLTSIDPVSPQLYQSRQDGPEATRPAPSLSTSRQGSCEAAWYRVQSTQLLTQTHVGSNPRQPLTV